MHLPKAVELIKAKGGKQPNDKSHGKIKFPIIAPRRPNIINSDTVMVL